MKKLDNLEKSFKTLRQADFRLAKYDDIQAAGIFWQFGITFELSWKCLQEVLRLHGVVAADRGSPREILQLAFKHGFILNESLWLAMLRTRNKLNHIYDASAAELHLMIIHDDFLDAFENLIQTLKDKIQSLS